MRFPDNRRSSVVLPAPFAEPGQHCNHEVSQELQTSNKQRSASSWKIEAYILQTRYSSGKEIAETFDSNCRSRRRPDAIRKIRHPEAVWGRNVVFNTNKGKIEKVRVTVMQGTIAMVRNDLMQPRSSPLTPTSTSKKSAFWKGLTSCHPCCAMRTDVAFPMSRSQHGL